MKAKEIVLCYHNGDDELRFNLLDVSEIIHNDDSTWWIVFDGEHYLMCDYFAIEEAENPNAS